MEGASFELFADRFIDRSNGKGLEMDLGAYFPPKGCVEMVRNGGSIRAVCRRGYEAWYAFAQPLLEGQSQQVVDTKVDVEKRSIWMRYNCLVDGRVERQVCGECLFDARGFLTRVEVRTDVLEEVFSISRRASLLRFRQEEMVPRCSPWGGGEEAGLLPEKNRREAGGSLETESGSEREVIDTPRHHDDAGDEP